MPKRPLQKLQASLVARRYYLENQTKSEIADKLGISRFKVARLIETALKEGIVHIEIRDQSDLNTELAERLREAYGLHGLASLELDEDPGATAAFGALLEYLRHTLGRPFVHLQPVERLRRDRLIEIDPVARRNLELLRPLNDDRGASLLSRLDRCATAAGR